MRGPIELSEDCYCNLSVPISNGQTLAGGACYVLVFPSFVAINAFADSERNFRNTLLKIEKQAVFLLRAIFSST